MRKPLLLTLIFLLVLSMMNVCLAQTRIKDVAKLQGVRANQLMGYGLVVGLAGTGDSNKSLFTTQATANLLKSYGVAITPSQIQLKNVAAVMVTAQLPAFAKPGDTIDITVSAMGDAKSLQGGMLLQTPLRAANGAVYAVGQGGLSIGGYSAGGGGQQKNFPTVGLVPSGAIVERDVPMQFTGDGNIILALNNPDFTTADRISDALNGRFGSIAKARDPGAVVVSIPSEYADNTVSFIAAMEELPITPDAVAKIVINERTGTIVMGTDVTIGEVAVAQGSLTVKITNDSAVSQPEPRSQGKTTVTNKKDVNVDEQKGSLIVLPAATKVGDVVNALNAVGATPRDIMAILQAMKSAGALHAELQLI